MNKKTSNKNTEKTIKKRVKTNKNLRKLNFEWLNLNDKKVKARLNKVPHNIKFNMLLNMNFVLEYFLILSLIY